MAFKLGKFLAGAGQGALGGLQAEHQNKLAMDRDQKLAEQREAIMAAKQEKLAAIAKAKPWGAPVRVSEGDKNYMAGMTYNDATGEAGLSKVEIPGELVSTLGETGDEQSNRIIRQKAGEESKKLDVKIEKEPELEEKKSYAKEKGKAEVQLEMLPKIQTAVKKAESEAIAKGESLSEYRRAQAALPGIQEVVGKLKTLSDVSTYTMAGRAFDTVAKELGFGATEGSTARAKMESLVDNQILPLLKDTFGAQFTEKEGEKLRKTMLDINAAPEQKKAILDSFLEQKMRNLGTKEREIGTEGASTQTQFGSKPGGQIMTDANGNRAMVYPDGSFEEI